MSKKKNITVEALEDAFNTSTTEFLERERLGTSYSEDHMISIRDLRGIMGRMIEILNF